VGSSWENFCHHSCVEAFGDEAVGGAETCAPGAYDKAVIEVINHWNFTFLMEKTFRGRSRQYLDFLPSKSSIEVQIFLNISKVRERRVLKVLALQYANIKLSSVNIFFI
jgi:hypothetical protein